jgi:hypothetical protein
MAAEETGMPHECERQLNKKPYERPELLNNGSLGDVTRL